MQWAAEIENMKPELKDLHVQNTCDLLPFIILCLWHLPSPFAYRVCLQHLVQEWILEGAACPDSRALPDFKMALCVLSVAFVTLLESSLFPSTSFRSSCYNCTFLFIQLWNVEVLPKVRRSSLLLLKILSKIRLEARGSRHQRFTAQNNITLHFYSMQNNVIKQQDGLMWAQHILCQWHLFFTDLFCFLI